MRRHAPRLLVLTLTLTLGAAAQEPAASPWGTDLPTALARAAREDRPLAVVFRCEP